MCHRCSCGATCLAYIGDVPQTNSHLQPLRWVLLILQVTHFLVFYLILFKLHILNQPKIKLRGVPLPCPHSVCVRACVRAQIWL